MLQIYKYNINTIIYFDNLTLNILFFFNSQEIKNYFPKSFYKIYKAHEPCAPTIFSYPYGNSANHLAGPKIRMATQQTTWRAQKSVWQLRQPLGEPKNPYGGSANHLASPKIRMAAPPTTWYGGSANHLAGPKIRMAAPPTTWRA